MHPLGLIVFIFSFAFCILATNISYAGVTTVQALSFGSFIVRNNDAQYDVTININSSYTFDSAGYFEISAPAEGIYDLDGMTPSTAIASVGVTQISALTFGGKSFQMVSFQESHPGSTDGAGVARIEVGATARGSGDSTAYPDGTYNGTVQIQINF